MMVRIWEKIDKQKACWPLGPGSRKISCSPLRPDPMCHGWGSCRMWYGRSPLYGRLGEVPRHDTHRPPSCEHQPALLIDLLAYLAPRAIQYLGAVSEWLNPGVSIFQGSRNSNNWARILLLDVLERAQAHVPWVYPSTSTCSRSARRGSSRSTPRTPPSTSSQACGARGYASHPILKL